MKLATHLLAATALALGLSACGTVGGGSTVNGDTLLKILTDPNCAHDDKLSFVTGAAGIPASLTGSAERHCPGPGVAPPK